MNTEKLNQAINNGKNETKVEQPKQSQSTRESGSNLLENAARIFAAKLQEPFNNALISELGVGFQNYMEDLANKTEIQPQDTSSNPVIDIFCKTHTEAYSNGNIRFISSTSVSASLPPTTTNTNSNGGGFSPKN